jgi:hypothetical protein
LVVAPAVIAAAARVAAVVAVLTRIVVAVLGLAVGR